MVNISPASPPIHPPRLRGKVELPNPWKRPHEVGKNGHPLESLRKMWGLMGIYPGTYPGYTGIPGTIQCMGFMTPVWLCRWPTGILKRSLRSWRSCDLLHVCSPASSIFAIVQHPDSHQQLPTPATTWRTHSSQLLKGPMMRNSLCNNNNNNNNNNRFLTQGDAPWLLLFLFCSPQGTRHFKTLQRHGNGGMCSMRLTTWSATSPSARRTSDPQTANSFLKKKEKLTKCWRTMGLFWKWWENLENPRYSIVFYQWSYGTKGNCRNSFDSPTSFENHFEAPLWKEESISFSTEGVAKQPHQILALASSHDLQIPLVEISTHSMKTRCSFFFRSKGFNIVIWTATNMSFCSIKISFNLTPGGKGDWRVVKLWSFVPHCFPCMSWAFKKPKPWTGPHHSRTSGLWSCAIRRAGMAAF